MKIEGKKRKKKKVLHTVKGKGARGVSRGGEILSCGNRSHTEGAGDKMHINTERRTKKNKGCLRSWLDSGSFYRGREALGRCAVSGGSGTSLAAVCIVKCATMWMVTGEERKRECSLMESCDFKDL